MVSILLLKWIRNFTTVSTYSKRVQWGSSLTVIHCIFITVTKWPESVIVPLKLLSCVLSRKYTCKYEMCPHQHTTDVAAASNDIVREYTLWPTIVQYLVWCTNKAVLDELSHFKYCCLMSQEIFCARGSGIMHTNICGFIAPQWDKFIPIQNTYRCSIVLNTCCQVFMTNKAVLDELSHFKYCCLMSQEIFCARGSGIMHTNICGFIAPQWDKFIPIQNTYRCSIVLNTCCQVFMTNKAVLDELSHFKYQALWCKKGLSQSFHRYPCDTSTPQKATQIPSIPPELSDLWGQET